MRRSLIIVVLLFFLFLAHSASGSIVSDDLSAELYNPETVDLSDGIDIYHTRIADYFNEKMLLFLSRQGADLLPPLLTDGKMREACDPANISTYCVAMGAMDEYLAYVKFLEGQKQYYQSLAQREQARREGEPNVQEFLNQERQKLLARNEERRKRGLPELDIDAEMAAIRQSLGLSATEAPGVPVVRSLPIGAATFSAVNRLATIEQEMTNTKRALDTTIAAYQEFRMAYALHREYKTIIDQLKIVRDHLATLRREVEKYPAKFIDASSPSCT